jgi:hypothetical protein
VVPEYIKGRFKGGTKVRVRRTRMSEMHGKTMKDHRKTEKEQEVVA